MVLNYTYAVVIIQLFLFFEHEYIFNALENTLLSLIFFKRWHSTDYFWKKLINKCCKQWTLNFTFIVMKNTQKYNFDQACE